MLDGLRGGSVDTFSLRDSLLRRGHVSGGRGKQAQSGASCGAGDGLKERARKLRCRTSLHCGEGDGLRTRRQAACKSVCRNVFEHHLVCLRRQCGAFGVVGALKAGFAVFPALVHVRRLMAMCHSVRSLEMLLAWRVTDVGTAHFVDFIDGRGRAAPEMAQWAETF